MSKSACLGLVVAWRGHEPYVLETLSDPGEIELISQLFEQFEAASNSGSSDPSSVQPDPLTILRERRGRELKEKELFGNFVETLVTDPGSKMNIRQKGMEWFRSALRLERYQAVELDAAKVIADFALELYGANPEQRHFVLHGKKAEVDVQIFEHPQSRRPSKHAA